MQDESSSILTSPGFLVALFLLLLNDFFLKSLLHNSFTGKLSDFAGLFVFPLFWVAVLPRFRSWIYLATAGLFIVWKSPASTILIDSWNSLGWFSISRTIDYTDLSALAILPLSYFYGLRVNGMRLSRAVPIMVGIVSVFAFTATSFSHRTQYDKEFYFSMTKRDLLERMSRLSREEVGRWFWEADDFSVSIESCIEADFSVQEKDQQSIVKLKETNYRCPRPPSKEEMLRTFEQEFVAKLSETQTNTPSKIRSIQGVPKSPSPSPTQSKRRSPQAVLHRLPQSSIQLFP